MNDAMGSLLVHRTNKGVVKEAACPDTDEAFDRLARPQCVGRDSDGLTAATFFESVGR